MARIDVLMQEGQKNNSSVVVDPEESAQVSNRVAEWKRKWEQKKFKCAAQNSRKKLGGVNKLCFIRVKTISRIVWRMNGIINQCIPV